MGRGPCGHVLGRCGGGGGPGGPGPFAGGAGAGQEAGEGLEGLGGRLEHRHGAGSGGRFVPGFLVGQEGGASAGLGLPDQEPRFGGQCRAAPEPGRQRLDDGERRGAGPAVQEPLCAAVLPQGSHAVADHEGEPAARGVVELVGRAQPGVVAGPGGGADERDAAVARVQMVDADAAEGAGLLAGLAQFLDQLPPDGHRGAGVHQELDVAAPHGRPGRRTGTRTPLAAAWSAVASSSIAPSRGGAAGPR